jgi:hypothetical protein
VEPSGSDAASLSTLSSDQRHLGRGRALPVALRRSIARIRLARFDTKSF